MVEYKTRDINFGAFLMCLDGTELFRTVIEQGTVWFFFRLNMPETELELLRLRYFNDANGLTIPVRQYTEKQNRLRDLIFETMKLRVEKVEKKNE